MEELTHEEYESLLRVFLNLLKEYMDSCDKRVELKMSAEEGKAMLKYCYSKTCKTCVFNEVLGKCPIKITLAEGEQ